MTKEAAKANELIEKFREPLAFTSTKADIFLKTEIAKSNALKCVDEIMDSLTELRKNGSAHGLPNMQDFYEDVKQIIINK